MTDPELIARVLASEDRAAFGLLVSRHQSAVRHFLRHLTGGNTALADDLAQETFLTAWRSLARFTGDSSLVTWLLGIAHNHWRNARRRERAHEPLDPDADHISVPSAARQADLDQDLTAALAQLPRDEQLVLHLAFRQGLPHGKIATLLDWPLGTVKTHLARGKARLRPLLAAWNPHP